MQERVRFQDGWEVKADTSFKRSDGEKKNRKDHDLDLSQGRSDEFKVC